MGAVATRFESSRRPAPRASRAATEGVPPSAPLGRPDCPALWEALLHPALLPTVFVPSGAPASPAPPPPHDDEEDVAERKV